MRAFICVGAAVIAALCLIGVEATYCTTCCNGEPCNPELRNHTEGRTDGRDG